MKTYKSDCKNWGGQVLMIVLFSCVYMFMGNTVWADTTEIRVMGYL